MKKHTGTLFWVWYYHSLLARTIKSWVSKNETVAFNWFWWHTRMEYISQVDALKTGFVRFLTFQMFRERPINTVFSNVAKYISPCWEDQKIGVCPIVSSCRNSSLLLLSSRAFSCTSYRSYAIPNRAGAPWAPYPFARLESSVRHPEKIRTLTWNSWYIHNITSKGDNQNLVIGLTMFDLAETGIILPKIASGLAIGPMFRRLSKANLLWRPVRGCNTVYQAS